MKLNNIITRIISWARINRMKELLGLGLLGVLSELGFIG